MTRLHLLNSDEIGFPPVESALAEPNGLLAVGGELTPEWLLAAYHEGIFPWFDDDDGPILWWSPDPRAVLPPDRVRVTRSLARRLRTGGFRTTVDTCFADVVEGCAAPRRYGPGTWITPRMRAAYQRLHEMGYAHSVEVWRDDALVGGLYGISLGTMFFGESMFSRERDASKVALVTLARQLTTWEFSLIDCQVMNEHLRSLGAREMPRETFRRSVACNRASPTRLGPWRFDLDSAAG